MARSLLWTVSGLRFRSLGSPALSPSALEQLASCFPVAIVSDALVSPRCPSIERTLLRIHTWQPCTTHTIQHVRWPAEKTHASIPNSDPDLDPDLDPTRTRSRGKFWPRVLLTLTTGIHTQPVHPGLHQWGPGPGLAAPALACGTHETRNKTACPPGPQVEPPPPAWAWAAHTHSVTATATAAATAKARVRFSPAPPVALDQHQEAPCFKEAASQHIQGSHRTGVPSPLPSPSPPALPAPLL